jgi:hypothetical protein
MPPHEENRHLPDELGPETLLLAFLADDDVALPRDQVVELEEDVQLDLLATRLEDGRQALLAFTSEDELREWRPEGGPYVEMRAADLLPLSFEHGNDVVVVNPASARIFVIAGEDFPPGRRPGRSIGRVTFRHTGPGSRVAHSVG